MKEVKKALNQAILGTVNKRLNVLEQKFWLNEFALLTLLKSPKYTAGTRAGFNEQTFRKEIFNELNTIFNFEQIIETGTFTGNTTGYIVTETKLPIYSAEVNELFYYLAGNRLSEFDSVNLFNMDSISMLNELASRSDNVNKRTFFYLDAHWYDSLPLAEEIEIIAKNYSDYAIMIDDFKVEGDPGYVFDDYGVGKALTLECFGKVFDANDLDCYFPNCASTNETGSKTGSIVLLKKNESNECLSKITKLRKYS